MARMTKAEIRMFYQSTINPSADPKTRATDQRILGNHFYHNFVGILRKIDEPLMLDRLREMAKSDRREEPTTQEYISFIPYDHLHDFLR